MGKEKRKLLTKADLNAGEPPKSFSEAFQRLGPRPIMLTAYALGAFGKGKTKEPQKYENIDGMKMAVRGRKASGSAEKP